MQKIGNKKYEIGEVLAIKPFINFLIQYKFIFFYLITIVSISINIFLLIKKRKNMKEQINLDKVDEFNGNYKYSIDLFKELYKDELDFKEKINAKISIPTSVVILLFGAVFYFISNLKYLTIEPWRYIFYFLFTFFLIALIVVVFFIFRAYYNYKYQVLQTPVIFSEYIKELINDFKKHDNKHNHEDEDRFVSERLNHYLNFSYMRNTEINAWLNSKKLVCLKYISWFLIIAVTIGALSIIPYQLAFEEKSEVQQVKIIK